MTSVVKLHRFHRSNARELLVIVAFRREHVTRSNGPTRARCDTIPFSRTFQADPEGLWTQHRGAESESEESESVTRHAVAEESEASEASESVAHHAVAEESEASEASESVTSHSPGRAKQAKISACGDGL